MSDPTTVLTPEGVVRTAQEAETLGIQPADPSVAAADARAGRRRAMFDTLDDKVGTFVEGVVDALSLGLIRETGEAADIRRDVNTGSAMLGNALGFAAGMTFGGPVRAVTKGAEAAGKAAAKTVLRSGEGAMMSRVAAEAAASMGIAGAQATGHALMDSILEDKEFSSEAILDEVKLAGVLGAAGGVVLHGLSKVGSRADIKAQGGVLGDVDEALKPHVEATRAYDGVLERHAAEVGAMKQLHSAGGVPEGMLEPRTAALAKATKAREALDKIDMRKAMSGSDDALYRKWQAAGVEYRAAIRELDDAMHAPAPRAAGDIAPDNLGHVPDVEAPAGSPRSRAVLHDAEGLPPGVMEPDLPKLDLVPEDAAAIPRTNWRVGSHEAARLVESKKGLPSKAKLTGYGDPKMASGLPDRARVGNYSDPRLVGDPVSVADPLGDAHLARVKAGLAANASARAEARALATGQPIDLTPPAEVAPAISPDIPPARAGRVTREIAVDPAEYGRVQSRMPMSANDLPDIHQPEPSRGGLTPEESTGAASPGALRAEAGLPDPVQPLDLPLDAPPKPRPLDAAEARVQQAMSDLVERTRGRLDSAGSLGLLERSGIRLASDNVGAYMDQVYALRKAGILAADAARGVSNPLTKVLEGAMAGGFGHAVAGPLGAVAAVAADMMYAKGGRIAAATGRLMGTAARAAEKLLTSKRVRVMAAVAANRPHAYSERGPIADPIERIQEIQWLAANPVHIMERVAMSARDLADQPELLKALQLRAVNQIQRLSVRAPAIYFDKLNRPLMPPGGKMREFFEYENAVHDLPGLLDQLGRGGLTGPQAAALQESWPSVHVKVAAAFLADPEKLRGLPRETLRAVETITGMPLTNAKDPFWLARQAQAWQPVVPPAPPGKPQAFNINPTGAPTPSQANATGRAPGN